MHQSFERFVTGWSVGFLLIFGGHGTYRLAVEGADQPPMFYGVHGIFVLLGIVGVCAILAFNQPGPDQ